MIILEVGMGEARRRKLLDPNFGKSSEVAENAIAVIPPRRVSNKYILMRSILGAMLWR